MIAKLRGKKFPQFVDYVLRDAASKCGKGHNCGGVDAHWRPQYSRCLYCDIPYDVIGKMETFADDVRYIVTKQNLTHLIPERITGLKSHASSGQESKTLKYFRQLSRQQIKGLYRLYSPDFELFDYDASEYLSLDI